MRWVLLSVAVLAGCAAPADQGAVARAQSAAVEVWGNCVFSRVVALTRVSGEPADFIAVTAVNNCTRDEMSYYATINPAIVTLPFRDRMHRMMIEKAVSLIVERRANFPEQSPRLPVAPVPVPTIPAPIMPLAPVAAPSANARFFAVIHAYITCTVGRARQMVPSGSAPSTIATAAMALCSGSRDEAMGVDYGSMAERRSFMSDADTVAAARAAAAVQEERARHPAPPVKPPGQDI